MNPCMLAPAFISFKLQVILTMFIVFYYFLFCQLLLQHQLSRDSSTDILYLSKIHIINSYRFMEIKISITFSTDLVLNLMITLKYFCQRRLRKNKILITVLNILSRITDLWNYSRYGKLYSSTIYDISLYIDFCRYNLLSWLLGCFISIYLYLPYVGMSQSSVLGPLPLLSSFNP